MASLFIAGRIGSRTSSPSGLLHAVEYVLPNVTLCFSLQITDGYEFIVHELTLCYPSLLLSVSVYHIILFNSRALLIVEPNTCQRTHVAGFVIIIIIKCICWPCVVFFVYFISHVSM